MNVPPPQDPPGSVPAVDRDDAGRSPILGTVRALRVVLWLQAGVWVIGSFIGLTAYFVLGPNHAGLGWYVELRAFPATTIAIGAAATVGLVWFARRLPARPVGLRQQIRIVEALLLLDAGGRILAGLFSLWLVIEILVAVTALWYLNADETGSFLIF